MKTLLEKINACTICAKALEHEVRPVLSISERSKILVIGQAPGSVVHRTGIPWDDKSGERLRQWLGVSPNEFYDTDLFGILPMGFCYPGKGKSGDLPPRKECAPLWHKPITEKLEMPKLTLLIGNYAQAYYLGNSKKRTLTETVQNFESYLPTYLPLPHPSPRNNIWLKKNPWFEEDVIPTLKEIVAQIQAH